MANSVYSNGRASALQANLLGSDRINRMLDCTSVEDTFKVLSEVNFGDNISISSALDFEKLILNEEQKLFDFIKSTSPSEEFKKFILFKNDYHNAEAFVKAKHLKISVEDMLVSDGLIDKDLLKDAIFTDDYKSLPAIMAKTLSYCDAEFVSGKANGAKISASFVKAIYEEMFFASKSDRFLNLVFKTKVDCVNIGVALRLRNYSQAEEFFIPNGRLTTLELKKLCEAPIEDLKTLFKHSPVKDIVSRAFEEAENGKPLSTFERLADYYPLSLINKMQYSSSGSIPFMKYVFMKLNDITNVRIILVGLINGQDKQDIKDRLREE